MIDLNIFEDHHLRAALAKQHAEFTRHAEAGNLWLAEGCHTEALRIEAELRRRAQPQNVTPRTLKIAGS